MPQAEIADSARPCGITRAVADPALASTNDPVDTSQIQPVKQAQQWFGTDEADGCWDLPQTHGAICQVHRLDGGPHPNVL